MRPGVRTCGLAIGAAVAVVTVSPARCQELPDATELVRRIRDLHERRDMRVRGRLVVASPGKPQTVFQISILHKSLPQSVRVLWSITDPPTARMRILIEAQGDDARKIWLADGVKGRASLLPEKRWSDRVRGSDLAIADLTNDYLRWPNQEIVREEVFRGRPCYILRSQPDSRGDAVYTSVTAWIDREGLLPLRVVKQPKGAAAEKEFLVRRTRKTGGRTEAGIIEIRTVGTPGMTRLVFTAGSGNARIKDREVDPVLLFQPAER